MAITSNYSLNIGFVHASFTHLLLSRDDLAERSSKRHLRFRPRQNLNNAHVAHSLPLSTTMITSGFTNAPVSQFLVFTTVIGALVASLTDTRYYIHIQVVPHIWMYGQFWRLFTWQLCYTNSTEVLFAVLAFYNLRVIERLWGSRKFGVRVYIEPPLQGLCEVVPY